MNTDEIRAFVAEMQEEDEMMSDVERYDKAAKIISALLPVYEAARRKSYINPEMEAALREATRKLELL